MPNIINISNETYIRIETRGNRKCSICKEIIPKQFECIEHIEYDNKFGYHKRKNLCKVCAVLKLEKEIKRLNTFKELIQ